MLMHLHPTKEDFKARAAVMKALAHPTRLMMIEELSRGERCVADLRELAGCDLSTTSKHLALLKNSGIVEDEKRGKQVYYRLRVPCVLNFFHCLDSVITARDKLK